MWDVRMKHNHEVVHLLQVYLLNQANVDEKAENWNGEVPNCLGCYLVVICYFEGGMNNSVICYGEQCV